jgi:hypothetical protein
LQFSPQSLASAINGGLSASAYNQIQTEKKTSFLGFKVSDKFSVNTVNSALDQATISQIDKIIASIRSGVLAAAGTLGLDGAQAVIDAFQLNIGKVSLKGMNGQQIQDTLNSVFSTVADQLSTKVIPAVTQFQKAGEGSLKRSPAWLLTTQLLTRRCNLSA